MKNKIFKIVVGSLTTITIILCFTNVNASSINDNWSELSSNIYTFKYYDDIDSLNDLKGTIWKMNMNAFDTWEDWGKLYFALSINSNTSVVGQNIKDVPIIVQSRSSSPGVEINYSFRPTAKLNVVPLANNIQSLQFDFSQDGFSSSIYGYRYEIVENEAYIRVIDPSYYSKWFSYITGTIPYFSVSLDIGNTYDFNNPLHFATANASDIYILFNYGNWNYDIACESGYFNTQEEKDEFLLEFIKDKFTQITFESLAWYTGIQIRDQYYDIGYDEGFENGIQYANENNGGYRFPILSGVFNAVDELLSIQVFPNVRLSHFIFLPLVLGIVGMIFYFWRKD